MAPLQDNHNVREQRLHDGCCPNCGTRLYKITNTNTGVGGVRSKMQMFRKKNNQKDKDKDNADNNNNAGQNNTSKMTPLNIPGVVERGQCVKCADGNGEVAPLIAGNKAAVAVPTVKAVPIRVTPPATASSPSSGNSSMGKRKPPPPQSKPDAVQTNNITSNGDNNQGGGGNLKRPPEDLLGLNSFNNVPPASAPPSASKNSSAKSKNIANVVYPKNLSSGGEDESSSGEEGSSSSYETDSEYEDDDDDDNQSLGDGELEDVDLDLCRLESDHASSCLVNSLRHHDATKGSGIRSNRGGEKQRLLGKLVRDDDDDNGEDLDLKPAAKPSGAKGPLSKQIEESAERIRKLREEAGAVDMAFLEATASGQNKKDDGANDDKLECPSGMSPEVFYQLPPEMQKEVMEQDKGGSSSTSTADIDPETLASLPEHIRKEVLEQARREQQQRSSKGSSSSSAAPAPTPTPTIAPVKMSSKGKKLRRESNGLSQSTTAFLTECDINADEFENFPEEVKNDIMEERKRQSTSSSTAPEVKQGAEKIIKEDQEEGGGEEDFDVSGYDPETLASLPEDVRKEVLEEERRQREKRRREREKKDKKAKTSVVGAHSVNVPAGYDPETFEALPEDVRQELMEDAAEQRRYSAEGYDYNSIVDARVVQARPVSRRSSLGPATSCTYEGEYNMMGKRHGDGELKWANGDKYVGKFKDGFIQGRGTISFHDGTEYMGQWTKNRFHGEGTRRFNNGNVYNGNYVSGKRQGQGKCYFANGDMYVGDWKEDTIHGFGRYYYNNGHSFEGMFRNGKRNGRGKYQLTDGRVEIYRYVNDSRVGDGVRWSTNRKKAWRMNDGKVTKRVSIDEATAIAKRCGPLVEES